MIVEFTCEVPIPDSRKSFKAGQRFVFERERGQAFIDAGQAQEVNHLYKEDEPVRIVREKKNPSPQPVEDDDKKKSKQKPKTK